MINQKQFNEIQAYFNEYQGATIFIGYVFHMVDAVYIDFMNHNSGFIVSIAGGIDRDSLTLGELNNFLIKHAQKIRSGNYYLGLWLNPQNKRVYIDLSQHYDSIYNALDTANYNEQSHIWDCRVKKSLNVKTLQYE